MAQRAYWEQTNRHGEVDRIELHDSEYGEPSPELQFKGDKTGFTRQWDEITSESNDKLINIQANRIQIGKYDFRPRIENQTGFDILEDIRDSGNKRFHIVHKIDGTFEWAGWVTTRIFSYPEKGNNFFAHIRATDFEILKGQDYALDDTRQTFISTFADLFSELPEDTPIKTATSWVEENVTARVGNETYDFLGEIRHETKALRDFARTGDETDQPITKWEALEHVAEPGLLIRQMGGHVMIDQLTDLADPTAVNETIYDSTGTVTTATQSVDRRQTGYTTVDNGTPVVKVSSQNDTYPAIKRARNKYDHRTSISEISFPENIDLSGQASTSQSQLFLSDGSQQLRISFNSRCVIEDDNATAQSRYRIQAGSYYLQDDGSWSTSTNTVEDDMNKIKPVGTNNADFRNSVSLTTDTLPSDADGTLEVTVLYHIGDFSAVADPISDTVSEYIYFSFEIVNPIAQKNSTSINYQLTQDNFDAPVVLTLDDTWFGDGPLAYSVGALRHGPNNGDNITDTWRRRGQTIDYRNYHWNLLAEVIDMGRTNMRKLEADIWGAYDPTKVLDYNGSYFYFAGGKYDGTRGKWRVTLMELNLQTGSDTFDDIPKFTDETGSGSGSTSSGGGGGLDQSTADARYLQESNNLSDLDSASSAISNLGITATASELNRLDGTLSTVRTNLGLEIGTDVQAHSAVLDNVASNNATADLDLNSLAINGDDLFSLFYTEQEINSFFDLYYSKADLTDGDEDLHLNSLQLTSLTEDRIPVVGASGLLEDSADLTFDGSTLDIGVALEANTLRTDTGKFLSPTSYQFRNAGDTAFRDVEMAGLTATTGEFSGTLTAQSGIDVTGGTVNVSNNINVGDSGLSALNEFALNNNVTSFSGFDNIFNNDPSDVVGLGRRSAGHGVTSIKLLTMLSGGSTRGVRLSYLNSDVTNSAGLWLTFNNDAQPNYYFTENGNFGIQTAPTEALDVNGNILSNGNVLSEDFDNDTWAGNGYRGTNAGDWVVENLRVRNALEVYEFVAKQISSVGGKEILSIANGRIESVNAGANEIEVQDVRGQNATSFEAGDLWIVQVVDINNDLESGGTGSIVRSVRGSVTSVSGATLTVSVDSGSLSDLEENDLIVAYGSSNSDRNAIMYRNVDRSDDNLIMRMQTSVTSFSALTDPANTSVAYGDLNGYLGISSEEFGFFAGDVSSNYILATENQVDINVNKFTLDADNGNLLITDTDGIRFGLDPNSGGVVTYDDQRAVTWGTTDFTGLFADTFSDPVDQNRVGVELRSSLVARIKAENPVDNTDFAQFSVGTSNFGSGNEASLFADAINYNAVNGSNFDIIGQGIDTITYIESSTTLLQLDFANSQVDYNSNDIVNATIGNTNSVTADIAASQLTGTIDDARLPSTQSGKTFNSTTTISSGNLDVTNGNALAENFQSGENALADDSFIKVGDANTINDSILLVLNGQDAIGGGIKIRSTADGDPVIVWNNSSGSLATSTGTPTGTTGTNGNVTVFTNSSGEIHVENRLGITVNLSYALMG